MGTYAEVQAIVRNRHGRAVKSCWIAHVKELNGLEPRQAANRRKPTVREQPCPPWARAPIEAAMRELGLLPPE